MILGLTISQFTTLHVVLSFIGIAAGLIALPASLPRRSAMNSSTKV